MNEVVKTEYLPAVTVYSTKTQVVYRTSTYTSVMVQSRYTTVNVPVYVTNTRTVPLVKTNYVTSTNVRYTTVQQVRWERREKWGDEGRGRAAGSVSEVSPCVRSRGS